MTISFILMTMAFVMMAISVHVQRTHIKQLSDRLSDTRNHLMELADIVQGIAEIVKKDYQHKLDKLSEENANFDE